MPEDVDVAVETLKEIEVDEPGEPSGGMVSAPEMEAFEETAGNPLTKYAVAEHAEGLVCVELLLLNEAEQFALVMSAA